MVSSVESRWQIASSYKSLLILLGYVALLPPALPQTCSEPASATTVFTDSAATIRGLQLTLQDASSPICPRLVNVPCSVGCSMIWRSQTSEDGCTCPSYFWPYTSNTCKDTTGRTYTACGCTVSRYCARTGACCISRTAVTNTAVCPRPMTTNVYNTDPVCQPLPEPSPALPSPSPEMPSPSPEFQSPSPSPDLPSPSPEFPSPSPQVLSPSPIPGLSPQLPTVLGDPHMSGWGGISFEFQGWSGAVFALLSEHDTQLNAMFDSFGIAKATFTREIALSHRNLTRVHVASIAEDCGQVQHVPLAVFVNDRVVYVTMDEVPGLNHKFGDVVVRTKQHAGLRDVIDIETPDFLITVVKLEHSCHLDLRLRELHDFGDDELHGIVGQTHKYRNMRVAAVDWEFEGEEPDYEVSSLFAADFAFSRFVAATPAAVVREPARMNGHGVRHEAGALWDADWDDHYESAEDSSIGFAELEPEVNIDAWEEEDEDWVDEGELNAIQTFGQAFFKPEKQQHVLSHDARQSSGMRGRLGRDPSGFAQLQAADGPNDPRARIHRPSSGRKGAAASNRKAVRVQKQALPFPGSSGKQTQGGRLVGTRLASAHGNELPRFLSESDSNTLLEYDGDVLARDWRDRSRNGHGVD